ncbi:MAG: HAMP domain-containing protein [Methyloprofundus sp.]|nr:HAMP domain-containing protein [Methyloprofundus sp.]
MSNLKKTLKKLPIKHKLILIIMLTSSSAILLMALLITLNQAVNCKNTLQQQLKTLTATFAPQTSQALTLNNPNMGQDILQKIALQNNIIYSVIERDNADIFAVSGDASMGNKYIQQVVDTPPSLWDIFISNKISVSHDILYSEGNVGKLRIVSNLNNLYTEILQYITLMTIILGICLILSFLICSRLQQFILEPITDLQKTIDSIAEHKDYSLRVESGEKDNELKALIDGFNHMLDQTQLHEKQLAETSNSLERVLATRTSQLIYANEKRVLWLETMARFLKHELKNSSAGITTSLDWIERSCEQNEDILKYLERARTSMNTMDSLLDSAANASDLEANLYKEKQSNIDIGETVKKHITELSPLYPDISITTSCQKDLIIFGNEERLVQLLEKLLSNAVEHSDAEQALPIEVFVKPYCGKVQLIVSNHGAALPRDKETIFELFVSARAAERKTDENFGLGLYIVKLIAESHGGKVVAYDRTTGGTGATFEVTLPLLEEDKSS